MKFVTFDILSCWIYFCGHLKNTNYMHKHIYGPNMAKCIQSITAHLERIPEKNNDIS